MSLTISKSLVSVDWLYSNLDAENLIILDCTIAKITSDVKNIKEKHQIKGARFFDIKNTFSDKKVAFPNTVLVPEEFEEKAQELGINKESKIVCYDDLGIYSSPRVWWLFQLMGFKNIAVLNGGLPEWKVKNFPTEFPKKNKSKKGNFKVDYKPEKLKYTHDLLKILDNETVLIVDARSKGRFYGLEPEPRSEIRSGHIPNSISLPFKEVLNGTKFKSSDELKTVFKEFQHKSEVIFTCGSGITASILAFAAEIYNIKNVAVYDGSWTEWGSSNHLPIEL